MAVEDESGRRDYLRTAGTILGTAVVTGGVGVAAFTSMDNRGGSGDEKPPAGGDTPTATATDTQTETATPTESQEPHYTQGRVLSRDDLPEDFKEQYDLIDRKIIALYEMVNSINSEDFYSGVDHGRITPFIDPPASEDFPLDDYFEFREYDGEDGPRYSAVSTLYTDPDGAYASISDFVEAGGEEFERFIDGMAYEFTVYNQNTLYAEGESKNWWPHLNEITSPPREEGAEAVYEVVIRAESEDGYAELVLEGDTLGEMIGLASERTLESFREAHDIMVEEDMISVYE